MRPGEAKRSPAGPPAAPAAAGPLGVTLGDPAGIGPEVVAAALAARPALDVTVFGDRGVLERAARAVGVSLSPRLRIEEVTAIAPRPGQPTEETGAAQVAYLEAGIAAARRGDVVGLLTAPISKTWATRAGLQFPGQTELLAARTGTTDFAMMLAGPSLRVALVTTHLAVGDAVRLLGSDAGGREIVRVTCLVARALAADLGVAAPRVAVAGLNPHAGEGGLIGREELEVIAPAVAAARARVLEEGLAAEVSGPHVPDVVFRQAARDRAFDAVVCMLHDHGLVPLKLLDFDDAVNVTLGLPFPRTSPDHGVAYDLAGRGQARPASTLAALDLLVAIAARRAVPRPATD